MIRSCVSLIHLGGIAAGAAAGWRTSIPNAKQIDVGMKSISYDPKIVDASIGVLSFGPTKPSRTTPQLRKTTARPSTLERSSLVKARAR